MKLIYDIKDKPKFGQVIVFAFQQLLAILAATIAVPTIIGHDMSQSAALFGAGIGTIVYLLFTKFRSPVFLGSSFAFIGSMLAAFAGSISMQLGYLGLILGAFFAGLVYVVIAIAVKISGVKWINKLMPAVVIGPTVSIIGLSLAGNAISDLTQGKVMADSVEQVVENGTIVDKVTQVSTASPYVALICGLVTLFTVILCSVYGKKMMKLIPFIIGILAGYVAAAIFTAIGIKTNNTALQIIDFSVFSNMKLFAVPDFTFIEALKGTKEITGQYVATIAVAYVPVAFVVFAEHIADHKNISSIIEKDLLKDLKDQEKLCVDKYKKHADAASDPQLKNLFSEIAQIEQRHLDTVTQMDGGTVPQTGNGGSTKPTFTAKYSSDCPEKQSDCYLCSDVLATEKHASHLYDTCIFEFNDENARNALNHIQKEEQEHGKMIYDYMSVNGMYS